MEPILTPALPGHAPVTRPGVIVWFQVYCVVLAVLYLLFAGFGAALLLVDPAAMDMAPTEANIVGAMLLLTGLFFLVASILPLLLKPRPWVWVYDLVVICGGMTSACFIPLCVPLLIFWIKPEVRAWFANP